MKGLPTLKNFKILIILIFSLLWVGSTYSIGRPSHPAFESIKKMATQGLAGFENGEKNEETLLMLEEALLRGQDWIQLPGEEEFLFKNADEIALGEDAEFMSKVIEAIILLRKELREESDEELLFLLFGSTLSTVSKDKNTFENIPNIYPEFKEITDSSDSSLKKAISLMAKGKLKEAEKILLVLYYDTWFNGNNSNIKNKVANKLGLLYYTLQLPEKCYKFLRPNKIEMEEKGKVDNDYVETLVYMGFSELLKYSTPIIGNLFLDVAQSICKRQNLSPDIIMEDYKMVIEAKQNRNNDEILKFIQENDKNFFFLTENERIIRWDNISNQWESLKNNIYKGDSVDLNSLLNAFQYEKQILLRSALKVKDALVASKDKEAVEMLDSLLTLKMEMTTPMAFGDRFDKLEGDYQKVQKYLMHHPALEEFNGVLYSPVSTREIASELKDDETFIDFGQIKRSGQYLYYAIIVTRDCPEGWLVELIPSKSLHNFIGETESEDARTMVENRYVSNEFLYENLWEPLFKTGLLKEKILYCPEEDLNVIMLDAIGHNGDFLGEKHEFHILTSVESLDKVREGETYVPENLVSFCGMEYIGDRESLIDIAQHFGSQRPIRKHGLDTDMDMTPGIHLEYSLSPLGKEKDYTWMKNLENFSDTKVTLLTGEMANEYLFKSLGDYKGAVNISTHAFNLPRDYQEVGNHYSSSESIRLVTLEPVSTVLLPLYRTGLMFSGAERSWTGRNFIDDIEDGILNGEELSSLDLSGVELVTLMACSSGSGEIDEYEGIIGLRRALKMAGCGSIIATAWNLDLEASLTYLKAFYESLVKGVGIPKSHRAAQLELIKRYEDPYYWALFQLID